jgi:hypothetical protein
MEETMNLPLRSRTVAMLFQALTLAILSLYDFLLVSYITGKLRTQYINFSSDFCLQFILYKKYKHSMKKHQLFLPGVTRILCRHAEVKVQMPQPHDAAAPAQRPGMTLLSMAFNNQSP